MATPRYVRRIARLPDVFELLAARPAGLRLSDLAEQVGTSTDELREDLLAFYTADLDPLLFGLSRPPVLEFLGPDGDDDIDPNEAEVVRLIEERPPDELGVEYVDAASLGLVYSAAKALLDMNPEDTDLRGAIDALTETMVGSAEDDLVEGNDLVTPAWNKPLEPLQEAVAARRRVRIVYSRSWAEGVTERVIEPYLLVKTRRGWEVDAGPPDEQRRLRTFLLPHLREVEVLDEGFEPPADLDDLLRIQRTTTRVRVRVPHDARWAADFYAEQVALVADDELGPTLDLDLLPPVEDRVGLLLLIAGEEAQVLSPPDLIAAGPRLAAQLLAHHRG